MKLTLSQELEQALTSRKIEYKPFRIGYRMVPIYSIPVEIRENDEDYEFTFVDHGNKKVMAVF